MHKHLKIAGYDNAMEFNFRRRYGPFGSIPPGAVWHEKADLFRFVGFAFKRAVFWETADDARAFTAHHDSAAIEATIDEALEDVRAPRS